jgi:hypothetical protein
MHSIHNKSIALSLLALTACAQESDIDSVREALPDAKAVAVNLPENAESPAALGALADTYKWTRATTRTLNGITALVLLTVHTIVQYPPTKVEGSVFTWGPHSDALDPAEWRLTVTALGHRTYDWQLHARRKNEGGEFLLLLDGHSVGSDVAHRGHGHFRFDLDALFAVNPIDNPDAQGAVSVDYAHDLGGFSNVAMDFEGLTLASYRYTEAADGSGSFDFDFQADVQENGSALEDARLRSRWLASGEGRADGSATGGDLESDVFNIAQCWDENFISIYEEFEGVSAGNVEACAFSAELPDSL